MALLTNPNPGDGKIIKFLLKHRDIVCVVIYFSGILWFLGLAHKAFNDGTYFSENALLPGLVRGEFDEELTANQLYSELQDVMKSNPNEIPFDWLINKFNSIDIETYTHKFALKYPLVKNITYYGENLYAILRAPRSSSTESIVVSAPFRTLNSGHEDCSASIALIIALAKFCRRQKYWAKDIIFLITDHEQLGIQAWLQAYHDIQLDSGILNYGNLNARAGSIQAAVNLEIHFPKISHIDVKVEGLNGQLPNLDLVNLVHKLCKNEGINHTFKNRSNLRKKSSVLQQWIHSLVTLTSMVWTQASCVPNGNHGLYHRFGIEAVTLEGFKPSTNYRKQVAGLHQTGRILEGILRSLNNLLERFHQSYFFYLLPSNDRFISIGSYMPSVSLVGAALLIKGLTLWLKLYTYFKPKTLETQNKCDQTLQKGKFLNTSKKTEEIKFFGILMSLIVSHLIGWFFNFSGTWLSQFGSDFLGISSKSSIYFGFFVLFCFSLSIPYFFKFNIIELDILNIIALLELSNLLLIIAMLNFSLSFMLSIIYVPCVCFFSTRRTRFKGILSILYMFLIHPFILTHAIVMVYTFITQENSLLFKAFSATQNSFVYLIVDEMIYGNWLGKAIFGFLVPNWILFWIHLCLQSKSNTVCEKC